MAGDTGSDLIQVVALLGAGVVAVPIFKRLGLGSVLGYLTAGVAIGPFGVGLFHEPQAILHVAELGVVMYFVVKVADLQGASLDGDTGTLLVLRRCDLESGRCSDLLPARGGPGRALLAD